MIYFFFILLISDSWWQTFVKSFVTSVETITGQHFDLPTSHDALEDGELEALHHKIEDLEKEVSQTLWSVSTACSLSLIFQRDDLQKELSQQAVEISTLRSLSTAIPVHGAKAAGRGGSDVRSF